MDDEVLVGQALAGETQAVAALYDRYADRLYDYARRLTGNSADAGDAMHDAFLIAMQRLGQLRDPSRFRPWIYAIVRCEVHRRHARTARLQFGVWDDPMSEPLSTEPAPSTAAEITELQRLIAEAANGLSDDDREVLDLHLRHGLNGPELAAALAVPERHVSVIMQRVRERLARGLGAVLVGRAPSCTAFAELREREGGELTELTRKRLARHIDGCAQCLQDREERLRPELLLGALPMALAPSALRATTLTAAPTAAVGSIGSIGGLGGSIGGGATALDSGWHWLQSGFPRMATARRLARAWLAVAAGGTTLVAGGALLVVRDQRAESQPPPRTTVAAPAAAAGSAGTGTGTGTTVTSGVAPATVVVTTVALTPTTVPDSAGGPATSLAAAPPGGPTTVAPPTTGTPAAPTTAPDASAPTVQGGALADLRISSQGPGGTGTCYVETSTLFTVTVTDDVGATRVDAIWVAPGGAQRTTQLTRSGNVWSGTVGPFPFAEIPVGDVVKYDVSVAARDAAGHVTNVTYTQLGVVDSCPLT